MEVRPSLQLLVNEVEVMKELSYDSIKLIHSTKKILAIKKIITIQEIIQMNLDIQERFKDCKDIVWDVGSLKDLKQHRHEAIVYHYRDFDPQKLFKGFSDRLQGLLNTIQHRMEINL